MSRRVIRWMFVSISVLVLAACTCPFFPIPVKTADVGYLDVNIDYVDTWYRETFDYSRQADNVKHYVLVVPESEAARITPGEVFTNLDFVMNADITSLDPTQPDWSWVADVLYEAPEGYFSGEFAPGRYAVAVAFIAASLSQEEAGVSGDVILYPGVTGGGASTDYQEVVIEPGKTTAITFTLTDANGWACPWLYIYNGDRFERRTEILRNLRGGKNERTEITPIGTVSIINGMMVLKIAEEKEEITFVDEMYLIVGGENVPVQVDSDGAREVAVRDQDYLVIASGESVELRFKLPDSLTGLDQAAVSLVVTGFYVPSG